MTDRRKTRPGQGKDLQRATPIPGYKRMCGWCGKVQQFVHHRNMTVCGVCGN